MFWLQGEAVSNAAATKLLLGINNADQSVSPPVSRLALCAG
jgi:hypothetical protein